MIRARQDFVEPTPAEFLAVLCPQQRGSGSPLIYHSPHLRQRGFGLGSILRSLASTLLPFARTKLLPSLVEAGGNFASGVIDDMGKMSLRKSLKKRGKTAGLATLQGVKRRMQTGSGRRKRRPRRQVRGTGAVAKPRRRRKSIKRAPRRKSSVVRGRRRRKDVLS